MLSSAVKNESLSIALLENARPHLKKNSIDNYIRNINILHNKNRIFPLEYNDNSPIS